MNTPNVRIARIEIHAEHLEEYRCAVREVVEASVREEPGVLAFYVVAEKDDPTRFIVFELYASAEAYQSHRKAPHFKSYKATTERWVKSLQLLDTTPIALEAKPK